MNALIFKVRIKDATDKFKTLHTSAFRDFTEANNHFKKKGLFLSEADEQSIAGNLEDNEPCVILVNEPDENMELRCEIIPVNFNVSTISDSMLDDLNARLEDDNDNLPDSIWLDSHPHNQTSSQGARYGQH